MLSEQKALLERDGYIVLKNFLSKAEIESLRALCLSNAFNKTDSIIHGDVLSYKEFRDIILTDKLTTTFKSLVADDLYYLCEGSAVGGRKASKASRGFHSDSRGDDHDFSKEYPLYRLGFYLQDMDNYSDGLKLRPGSHKKLAIDFSRPYEACYKTAKYILKYKKIPSLAISSGINVACKAGDLIIWNFRTHHSGHARRLKLLPNLSLYPFIENMLPNSWLLSGEKERCILFLGFGKNDIYLTNYFYFMSALPAYTNEWERSDFSADDLLAKINALKVKLLYKASILTPESRAAFDYMKSRYLF